MSGLKKNSIFALSDSDTQEKSRKSSIEWLRSMSFTKNCKLASEYKQPPFSSIKP